ncbi:bifunctional DNA primase/polymerase [Phytohabitans sp. ZYX-F-186]|uniref:Bifunctional DNA primase/polymerase n=1 Tax=Phytohabitans maris TaxID=3071409 RepID=A0ABU0ZIJ3_9ACTN|nr:bifunctional DNA primase/polymerase [Phytohabitans sp. ZYX-F-186]MDQ7906869.1 bifunctional DNA primase/polymerase [Phytohabitans sp. ZYX-F-186]
MPEHAYRVLVTGSRTWPRPGDITTALDELHEQHGGRLIIVHGACPRGADAIADAWCRRRRVNVERWPADWSIGNHAGHVRNAAMVATAPALCLAFIHDRSPGATGCAMLAKEAKIPTIRHRRDQRPTEIAAAVRALRPGWRMCTGGCGWPVDPAIGCGNHPTCPAPDNGRGWHGAGADLLPAAFALARDGLPVFWLGRTKRPVANCPACPKVEDDPDHDPEACTCLTCHGFYAASIDPDRIAAMHAAVPGGMLAIRTGTASGRVVIDIDPRNGGTVLPELMPPTRCARTGSGGWHLHYRHPGGKLAGKLHGHPGIDIKADGGYVVAPPSIHPATRQPYRWVGDRPVIEMPPPLIVACRPAEPPPGVGPPAAPTPTTRGRGISSADALLAAHLDALARAPEGRRRTTLYGVARGVARMVAADAITSGDAYAVLYRAGRAAGQSDRDTRAAIADGFRHESVATEGIPA